jgi:hypothetical protein
MTSSEIESAFFRVIAQYFNQRRYRVSNDNINDDNNDNYNDKTINAACTALMYPLCLLGFTGPHPPLHFSGIKRTTDSALISL